MVDFVDPVIADNPLAYCPALISLYLEAKKTSGETQQSLWSGEYVWLLAQTRVNTLQREGRAAVPWEAAQQTHLTNAGSYQAVWDRGPQFRALAAKPAVAVHKRELDWPRATVELWCWASANWTAAGPGLAAAGKPDQRGEL